MMSSVDEIQFTEGRQFACLNAGANLGATYKEPPMVPDKEPSLRMICDDLCTMGDW